jgi:hypothetical protein
MAPSRLNGWHTSTKMQHSPIGGWINNSFGHNLPVPVGQVEMTAREP